MTAQKDCQELDYLDAQPPSDEVLFSSNCCAFHATYSNWSVLLCLSVFYRKWLS